MGKRAHEPKPLRFLDLCAGIGGISLSAEWAGMQVVGQVEIDPFCRRVLAKHWPDVKRKGDIRRVWGHDFGSVDVIGAGFPCQPASVAGQRRGAADARWLWPEVLRVIQVYQPTWVLLENVPGLISLGLDDVLTDLDAAGYEAWPLVLPAAAIGAPHLRERVFIVAHANQHSGRWQERARAGDVGSATRADAPREGHPQRYTAECGGEAVAHAACRSRDGGRHSGKGRRSECSDRCTDVGHTDSAGLEGQRTQGPARNTDSRMADAAGDGRRAWRPEPARQRGQAGTQWSGGRQVEPRLVREPDGLSRRLDGCIEPAPRHPWPTGPGQPQAPWEAPRTVTGTVPDRAARLKALGNAVVPQQVYPILAAIVAAHEVEATA